MVLDLSISPRRHLITGGSCRLREYYDVMCTPTTSLSVPRGHLQPSYPSPRPVPRCPDGPKVRRLRPLNGAALPLISRPARPSTASRSVSGVRPIRPLRGFGTIIRPVLSILISIPLIKPRTIINGKVCCSLGSFSGKCGRFFGPTPHTPRDRLTVIDVVMPDL